MTEYIVSVPSFWLISALAFLGFIVLLLSLWFFAVRNRHAIVYYNETETNKSAVGLCKTMKMYDRVPLWRFNGHIQSIYASQVRKGPTYELRRYVLSSFLLGIDRPRLLATDHSCLESFWTTDMVGTSPSIGSKHPRLPRVLSGTFQGIRWWNWNFMSWRKECMTISNPLALVLSQESRATRAMITSRISSTTVSWAAMMSSHTIGRDVESIL